MLGGSNHPTFPAVRHEVRGWFVESQAAVVQNLASSAASVVLVRRRRPVKKSSAMQRVRIVRSVGRYCTVGVWCASQLISSDCTISRVADRVARTT